MSLEWIIYLGDITPTLKDVLGFIGFICTVGATGLTGINISAAIGDVKPLPTKKLITILYICGLPCIMTAILIPSKEAIYMMAGSSAVKEALKTPEASKVLTLINLELDKQIDTLQKEKNHAN